MIVRTALTDSYQAFLVWVSWDTIITPLFAILVFSWLRQHVSVTVAKHCLDFY